MWTILVCLVGGTSHLTIGMFVTLSTEIKKKASEISHQLRADQHPSIADFIIWDQLPKFKYEGGEVKLDLSWTPGKSVIRPLPLKSLAGIKLIPYINKVTTLSLVNSELTELPDSIGDLPSLQDLNLNESHTKELPKAIGNLLQLKELFLRTNQLTELPDSIGNLRNLEDLFLAFNQLAKLPESIGQLQNLTDLNLGRNNFSQLPDVVGTLKNLKDLAISHNQLKELPDWIGKLQNLETLDVQDNPSLRTLPKTIGDLPKLKFLSVDGKKLDDATKEFLQELKKKRQIAIDMHMDKKD
jgi:Leucine-rich repeat (LRR) protein